MKAKVGFCLNNNRAECLIAFEKRGEVTEIIPKIRNLKPEKSVHAVKPITFCQAQDKPIRKSIITNHKSLITNHKLLVSAYFLRL